MIRLIVSDVLNERPEVPRTFFKEVARSMVRQYPTALHDRNKSLTDCQYMEQKLKFRYDEQTRAFKVKAGNEAPNIPEAYGCVRWRVKMSAAERESMMEKRTQLVEWYDDPPRDWTWETILTELRITFPLQREEINNQVPKRKRRSRGGTEQSTSENIKTTPELFKDWPFLFQSKGMKQHFQILTTKDWDETLVAFQEKYDLTSFIKFLSTQKELEASRTRKRCKRAKKNNTCRSPELIALVLMLTEYYKENTESIIIEIEVNNLITFLFSFLKIEKQFFFIN